MKSIFIALATLLLAWPVVTRAADPLEATVLVRDGHSAYAIYHAANAPASVREAAKELQRVLAISTAATLPIVTAPRDFMIVLGDTPETRQAGIDSAKLPEEGYEIKNDGSRVFIAGRDTGDGEFTTAGGISDGTYDGVMEWLERAGGVRWLMPGEWGEDVPSHPTLALPQIALREAPDFSSRSMTVSFGGISARWLRHLRITPSRQPIVRTEFNHAWHLYGMPERLQGHPEYMALVKGERTRIEDWHREMQGVKFCTTNEGLLDLYGIALLEEMAKNPAQQMWAIAPSDGGGWCECEKCMALDEACDWIGNRMFGKRSKTPRVLAFYNEIARRVKARRPDKVLGGYLYAAYTYPPPRPMAIEPNLFLMLAVRAYYGYTLYRPEFAQESTRLIDAWDASLKGRMGWVDYSTYVGMDVPMGTPYPPGKPILKLLFPQIRNHGWQTVNWGSSFGVQGWGSLQNYLVAKLMWHADADVDALAREWLLRAYGPGGGEIGEIYDLIEQKLATYKQANPKDTEYDAVPAQVKAIHLPLFAEMETRYREAVAKAQSDAQRKRLEMFGDNLILLHWHLRKAGWLAEPEKSMFFRSDAAFNAFIEKNSGLPSIGKPNLKPELYLKPQLGVAGSGPKSVDQ